MSFKIRRRNVPALVGLAEAAKIIGTKRPNLRAIKGVPEPLQDREIEGMEVGATPLWPRAEILELAQKREKAANRAQANRKG